MDHERFSNDALMEGQRRIRKLKDRIARLERGGYDVRQLQAELRDLQNETADAA